MPPVQLTAERFVLRAWTPADLDFVLQAARDPQIARFSSVGTSVTPDAGREWIKTRQAHDRLDWVIEHDRIPIGRISVAHINADDAVGEIGYWVIPSRRRAGVATAAVARVERHAFTELGLMRLVIKHEPENVASCSLASSRGYLPEGVERGAFWRAGARRDLHVHALLATDDAAQRMLLTTSE